MRGLCGSTENPMTPDIIAQWERHSYRRFSKWERDAFLGMDSTFRQANAKVLMWHQKRAKVKEDPDRKRMTSGRGNPRL